MKLHKLHIWPSFFEAIRTGEKTFELRRYDRDFALGDTITLQEWDPTRRGSGCFSPEEGLTGVELQVRVTYMLHHGQVPGLKKGFCILGIEAIPT